MDGAVVTSVVAAAEFIVVVWEAAVAAP